MEEEFVYGKDGLKGCDPKSVKSLRTSPGFDKAQFLCDLRNMSDLEKLNVRKSGLTNLDLHPDAVEKIRRLDIQENRALSQDTMPFLRDAPNLEEIWAKACGLTRLELHPRAVAGIKALGLEENKIEPKDLEEILKGAQSLEKAFLRETGLRSISLHPDAKIEVLDIQNNPDIDKDSISLCLNNAWNLKELLAKGCNLTRLKLHPSAVACIKSLGLEENKIEPKDLEEILEGAQSLEKAFLRETGLRSISLHPDAKIEVLDIQNNPDINQDSISSFLENAPNLEQLLAQGSGVKRLLLKPGAKSPPPKLSSTPALDDGAYEKIPTFIDKKPAAFNAIVLKGNPFNPFLPLRTTCAHFGAQVEWDGGTQQISITPRSADTGAREKKTRLSTKSTEAFVKGVKTQLSDLPLIHDGATYVPPNFLACVLGVEIGVGYNSPSEAQVNITEGKQRHIGETPFLIPDKETYYKSHLQDSKNEGISREDRIKHAQEALNSQNLGVLFDANLNLSHLVDNPSEACQHYRTALGLVRNSDQAKIMKNYTPTRFPANSLKTSNIGMRRDDPASPIKKLAEHTSRGR